MGSPQSPRAPLDAGILERNSDSEQRQRQAITRARGPTQKGAMKAVVLSAGQGKRLLPLTAGNPKCLLPVRGDEPILGLQLDALARAGFDRAVVVIGFGAERVEAWLAANPVPGLACESLFNPFYDSSDNLISCWLARGAMYGGFSAAERRHAVRGRRARARARRPAGADHARGRSQAPLRRRRHEGVARRAAGGCSRSASRCRPR